MRCVMILFRSMVYGLSFWLLRWSSPSVLAFGGWELRGKVRQWIAVYIDEQKLTKHPYD